MNIAKHSRAFLIVDYNLSRIEDVRAIKNYVNDQYQMALVLIRPKPGKKDYAIADLVIDLDPLDTHFVNSALIQLKKSTFTITAGLVFSDNAVHQGADLLEALEIYTDSALFARNAFCKFQYREQEQKIRALLEAQQLFVPDYQEIHDSKSLQDFIERNPLGVVIKPKQEGNNRGVIVLRNPDESERNKALAEVDMYMKAGVIAEQLIPYHCEYSFDGIGAHHFITEKFSVRGRYPVEIGQLVPAAISDARTSVIVKAGRLANLIVGQSKGAFHNEILVSDDNSQAAVVEANRRPAGMKIWTLASLVFEQNLYARWVDSVVVPEDQQAPLVANGSAMTIMLPPVAPMLAGSILNNLDLLIEDLKSEFSERYPAVFEKLEWISYDAIATENKFLHFPPRDNSDFIASLVVRSSLDANQLKPYFDIIRSAWTQVLNRYLQESEQLLA
jgi:hypothetical protein